MFNSDSCLTFRIHKINFLVSDTLCLAERCSVLPLHAASHVIAGAAGSGCVVQSVDDENISVIFTVYLLPMATVHVYRPQLKHLSHHHQHRHVVVGICKSAVNKGAKATGNSSLCNLFPHATYISPPSRYVGLRSINYRWPPSIKQQKTQSDGSQTSAYS